MSSPGSIEKSMSDDEPALDDDEDHAGGGDGRTHNLPRTHRLTEDELGEHHGEDRHHRKDEAGIDRGRVFQRRVHQPLRDREADAADDQEFEPALADEVADGGRVVPDDGERTRKRDEDAEEAKRPGRHLGDRPFRGDVDPGGKHPRTDRDDIAYRLGIGDVLDLGLGRGNRPEMHGHLRSSPDFG